jgi:hypothetical protein
MATSELLKILMKKCEAVGGMAVWETVIELELAHAETLPEAFTRDIEKAYNAFKELHAKTT